MAGNKDFDSVIDSTVYDSTGEKVGKVEQLYIADATDEPRWVSVKTGLFGTSKSLVPLAGAKHSGDRLEVAVTKSQIKDAPHLDSDNGTNTEEENALLKHYGLTDQDSGWNQYGKHTRDDNAGNAGAAGAGAAGAAGAAGVAGGRERVADGRERTADADRRDFDSKDRPETITRSEERLGASTERQEVGKARLRKYVVTEEQTINVPVSHEEVRVVREPITDGQAGDAKIGEAEAEVTLHADKVHTTKETVPVEKVGLEVNEVQGEQKVTDSVRKERIDTDGIDGERGDRDRHETKK